MDDPVMALGPKPPVTVPAASTVGAALACMLDRGVGAVLLTEDSGQLAGILTERDVLDRVAGQDDYLNMPAADVMTREPETVSPADTLAFALRKMSEGGYRHMPVVDDGRPVGVFSVRDLLRHVVRLCAAP